jgi:cold shock CspA family protein
MNVSKGVVKIWYSEEGWGSIALVGSGVECFAHFSSIVQRENEFLELTPGEEVSVEWHEAEQDEFHAVADRVERHFVA